MTIRFIHAADIHLGYRQYGSDERCEDFAGAFSRLAHEAIASKANYLLLAGDLFHKQSMEPRTLYQATATLQRLREAGIGVIAIEGNHERPRYSAAFSWLDYLAEAKLLILLNPDFRDGEAILQPWDDLSLTGAYIDLPGGVRVIGARYFGASTPVLVDALARALGQVPGPRPAYTILMLHAGIEGVLDYYSGGLTMAQLESLRPHVDYVALGHIHKPFVRDGWIYNPGSLETCSIDEAKWQDRGYFLLDVNPGAKPQVVVTQIPTERRDFVQIALSVNHCHEPESLYRSLESTLCKTEPRGPNLPSGYVRPVVELRLEGMLAFDRTTLDTGRIERMVRDRLDPLICRIRDLSEAGGSRIDVAASLTRSELERHVVRELVEQDASLRPAEDWAAMVLEIKEMALRRSSPEQIIAEAEHLKVEHLKVEHL